MYIKDTVDEDIYSTYERLDLWRIAWVGWSPFQRLVDLQRDIVGQLTKEQRAHERNGTGREQARIEMEVYSPAAGINGR